MPKILEDIRGQLLAATRESLETGGYKALSMRGVAASCSIAVGTIYNYFQSKEEMVAYVMMQDWEKALAQMDDAVEQETSFAEGLTGIYLAIKSFAKQYEKIWFQFSQGGGAGAVIARYHVMLRNQLVEKVQRLSEGCGLMNTEPLFPLLAETVLVAALQHDMDEMPLRLLAERISK